MTLSSTITGASRSFYGLYDPCKGNVPLWELEWNLLVSLLPHTVRQLSVRLPSYLFPGSLIII